jgi:tRNA/tmRNA/rRNA uracil-C5-methylase (TrmA/RlmC/RlmD family)
LAERIASRVADFVSSGDAVAELHAGVGAIGLGLLSRAGSLHLNERSEAGILGLERGLAERPEEERARASLFPGAAELRTDAFSARDVVIVDPPRGGLGDALVEALLLAAPKRLVYIACGLAAFLSESERLLAGGYRLTTLEAYDLFPFTEHVETFAVFDRPEI